MQWRDHFRENKTKNEDRMYARLSPDRGRQQCFFFGLRRPQIFVFPPEEVLLDPKIVIPK